MGDVGDGCKAWGDGSLFVTERETDLSKQRNAEIKLDPGSNSANQLLGFLFLSKRLPIMVHPNLRWVFG